MFACQECGKKFRTTAAAEKASFDGCPKCGGCDIDLDVTPAKTARKKTPAAPIPSVGDCFMVQNGKYVPISNEEFNRIAQTYRN